MRSLRSAALMMSVLLALPASPVSAWPVSAPVDTGKGGGFTLVQRSMPRQLLPLTASEVEAIARAVAAQKEHPLPTEDAATADGRKLLDKEDYLGAHDAFVALAMKGNAAALYMLGVMYTGGRGVKQDFPAAAKLFLICGEANNPYCQNALAANYRTGSGVPRDAALAEQWQDRLRQNPYVRTTTTRP